jgi:hypothetical protein
MQNERVELNILYHVFIREDFNDRRGRGVAHEHDARPSYDENVINTHTSARARTHTHTHTHTHTEKSTQGVRVMRLPPAAEFKGQQNGYEVKYKILKM